MDQEPRCGHNSARRQLVQWNLLPQAVHQAFLVKSLIDGSKRGVVEVLTKAINSECRISVDSPICRVVGKRPDRERYARIRHPVRQTPTASVILATSKPRRHLVMFFTKVRAGRVV